MWKVVCLNSDNDRPYVITVPLTIVWQQYEYQGDLKTGVPCRRRCSINMNAESRSKLLSFNSNGDISIWVRTSRERDEKQQTHINKKSVVSWTHRAFPYGYQNVAVRNITYHHILIHSCNGPYCSYTQTDTKHHKLGIYMAFHKIFRYNPWDRLYR